MRTSKWLIIIFFAIPIALTIGIALMNDESSRETIKYIWILWGSVVVIAGLINYIRSKRGSE